MTRATRRGGVGTRLLVLAAAAGILVSACGSTTPTPSPAAATPAGPTPATAPSVAVLTPAPATVNPAATRAPNPTTPATTNVVNLGMLVQTMVRNFNPFAQQPLMATRNGIYEPLMIYNPLKGEIVPWLADSFSWSADNTVLTLKLHPGVTWSDGEPFTASDVAFTFDLFSTTPGMFGSAGKLMGDAGSVQSVKAVDDTTVEVTFKTVNTNAIYDVIAQNIVPQHIWKDVTDILKFTNDDPVATGPFTQITSFAPQAYQIDKNPNYWQPGKPSVNALRYTAYASNDAQTIAMAAGDLDWNGAFIANIDTALIAKNPDLSYWFPLASLSTLLQLNTTVEPFNDPVVRKAMSMAVNRDQMIQVALSGYSTPSDVTGLSDGYASWKPSDVAALGNFTTYDPAAASAMLDQAGYKKGADGIRVTPAGKKMQYELLMVQGFSDWISAGEIMVANWKEIGIDVKTKMVDPGAYFGTMPPGNFQISLFFGYTDPTPYGVYTNVMSSKTVQPIGQPTGSNFARYASPAADALLAKWAATSDLAEQKSIAQQLMKVFADEAPIVPLWPAPLYTEYSNKSFQGWPTADNPYAIGMPAQDVNAAQLIVMTTIQPK